MAVSSEVAQLLEDVPLFASLGDQQRNRLAASARVSDQDPGTEVFSVGETAETFYLVVSGAVKVYLLSGDGREQILHLLERGELVAEAAVFNGGVYPASAMTTEPSRLAGFERSRILALMREDPELAMSVIGALYVRLREFVATIEDLSLRDVTARLARFLLEHSEDGVCRLPSTKTQLAARLGTVLEPLSRAFRRLREDDLIAESKGIVRLLDEEGLEMLVDGLG